MKIRITKMRLWPAIMLATALLLWFHTTAAANPPAKHNEEGAVVRTFTVNGTVEEVRGDERMVVIKHDAVPNYMPAMTMPFKAKDKNQLSTLKRSDQITFQLDVTTNDSWVDDIKKTGFISLPEFKKGEASQTISSSVQPGSLLDEVFTNELGQAVRLNDFKGQALAVTFFYTRCPVPNYCPRLSKNFQEASQKLEKMAHAPKNWHFISISFDPQFDTPTVLRAYGENYHYDPAHWSFLTGPADKINELARACDVTTAADGLTIRHNFRTLIIDATGHQQMVFPTAGDLSDQIVNQIVQAAKVTNAPAATPK